MEPTALIFHASRCGSTLLAKVIARSQANMVFGEAAPHNQIWRYIAASPNMPELLVRNIILQTGRRRLPTYQAHIVKFTSLNILKFSTIHAAFPSVPKLFLFRTPSRILASYRRAKPGWLGQDNGIAQALHTAEAAVAAFFRSALEAGDKLMCVDYADLRRETLPAVLNLLGLQPAPADLPLMCAEFDWDSKAHKVWSPHTAEGCPDGPPELHALYEQLVAQKVRW